MMRHLSTFILLIAILAAGCTHHRVQPFGWEAVSPQYDSLTLLLERDFMFRASLDTIQKHVAHLDTFTPTTNEQLRWRSDFWHARLTLRQGDDDLAFKMFLDLQARIDSSKHPYEWLRVDWLLEAECLEYDGNQYFRLLHQAQAFETLGDLPYAADRYMNLGAMLYYLGEYAGAEEMMDRADSLAHAAALPQIALANTINRANLYALRGPTRDGHHAESNPVATTLPRYSDNATSPILLLQNALSDSLLDPFTRMLALGNLYSWGADTTALSQAYALAHDLGDSASIAIYSNYKAQAAVEITEAKRFSDTAIALLPFVDDPSQIPEIYETRSLIFEVNGMSDSALHYARLTKIAADSLQRITRAEQVHAQETLRQIATVKTRMRHDRTRQAWWFAAAILLIVIISVTVGWALYRRSLLQRIASARASLDAMRSRRNMLAMQLRMQEMEKTLKESDKAHALTPVEHDAFMTTFAELNPEFEGRLRESHPDLSPAEVRLASLIACGLDNKQIARVQGIRPESVKQARWRLRSHLALPVDTPLTTYLRSLL
ncbi:MAG: hypothetical protein LIP02_03570 [Bacteroidales bacterium]|nr:hypothetical protein [Bacteroidales bacterium]